LVFKEPVSFERFIVDLIKIWISQSVGNSDPLVSLNKKECMSEQILRKLHSCIAQFQASLTCLGLFVLLSVPIRTFAQASVQPGTFGVKLSGFENLVGGGATFGLGGGASGSTESEIDVTPQYKTVSGTGFAARGVLNLLADSNVSGSSTAWSLTIPELSFFVIGDFGRIEVGDRAGFPQSLIGFTPSEIAFTSAEFARIRA
jgi:hypothetical protein